MIPTQAWTHHKGTNIWDNSSIGGQTVGNGTHTVFTDAVPNVGATVVAQTGAGGLEVLLALSLRQVTTSQIGGTTHEVRDPGAKGRQNDLGQLTRSLSRIGGGVNGER